MTVSPQLIAPGDQGGDGPVVDVVQLPAVEDDPSSPLDKPGRDPSLQPHHRVAIEFTEKSDPQDRPTFLDLKIDPSLEKG